mmetsp:Transcript_100117/g.283371  ORF Transcript_100117/g.283371 Transcript_100117/m.283371 type:complete len:354 (-) Transcript_100117:47-1108(-)
MRYRRGDQGVTKGARMPVHIERLLPSLVPRNLNELPRASTDRDRIEGVASFLKCWCHACPLQPNHIRGTVRGVLLELRTRVGLHLPTEPVDLRAGDELLGEVPLVRLPSPVFKHERAILVRQRRFARILPDVMAALLSVFIFEDVIERNVAISEREDHRAALHVGRFAEEVVALAWVIVEVVPLPAQRVHPCARAALKAAGAEGHLPVTAGGTLAHLEVEPELLEGRLQQALELERPALVHVVVVAGGHGRAEGCEDEGLALPEPLQQALLRGPALVAGREGTEDTLQYLFALLRPHVLKLVNGGLYDFVRMGGDLEARCQSRCGSKQDGLAHGGHDPRATARTIAVSACVCK